MFDVIDALEVLGADADLVRATSPARDAFAQCEGMEPALRKALQEGDAGALQTLMRAPNNVCCLINPAEPEEEEDEEEDEEDQDDDDEKDDKRTKR